VKIKNRELELTRDELFDMIKNDNPDRHDWSRDSLLEMISRFNSFSEKQYKWILSKVKYIINHNKKYSNFKRKFDGFEVVD
jgi:uncharacterized protein YfbU (UPF0304 family)